jgi:hypothetical protein
MPLLESQLQLKRCPHCSVNSPSLFSISQFDTTDYTGKNARVWKNYYCSRCGGAILAAASKGSWGIIQMYPESIMVSDDIPKRAKEYLDQAIESIHAPSGSIMLAASSIDAMLKNKGYKEGSLFGRINEAAKKHLITEEMSKWAHQVRLDANEQRHFDDDVVLPNEADAKKTIDFALALAEFLFVLPCKINKGIEDTKKQEPLTS